MILDGFFILTLSLLAAFAFGCVAVMAIRHRRDRAAWQHEIHFMCRKMADLWDEKNKLARSLKKLKQDIADGDGWMHR